MEFEGFGTGGIALFLQLASFPFPFHFSSQPLKVRTHLSASLQPIHHILREAHGGFAAFSISLLRAFEGSQLETYLVHTCVFGVSAGLEVLAPMVGEVAGWQLAIVDFPERLTARE